MIEGNLDSAAQKAGTSLGYDKLVRKALMLYYIGMVMRFTQRFGVSGGGNVSILEHLNVENIQHWAARCEGGSSVFAAPREGKRVVPIPQRLCQTMQQDVKESENGEAENNNVGREISLLGASCSDVVPR